MFNILFLGGAKRVSMARYFKRAAIERGDIAAIYSYELDTHVPISVEGHVYAGLRFNDPGVYDDLQRIIDEKGINVIIPFVDTAVAVAATMAERNPSVFVPAPAPDVAESMFDKVAAARKFKSLNIPIPATLDPQLVTEPICLIAKPAHGSASRGIIEIDDRYTLDKVLAMGDRYLIQRRIDNREEYTVDCYISKHTGQPLCIVPRLRIEVSGGEVTRTATVIHPEVYDLAKLVLGKMPLVGAVTIQIMVNKDNGEVVLMEVNPRLGGGAVCAVAAQANIPALILAEAAGETPAPVCYRPYTEIMRYPQEVVFYN